ncbi:unnamed protein product [Diatraea saccharalis]|uniref:Uncharacterized protein n=1 Tax=Diatraea saccharalis TaxID=40085 RepID=A0A9P0C8Y1_9NEOP|nr:unnamed protein product [Diatraea saccharalis]
MLSLYMIIFVVFLYVIAFVIERYQTENGSGGRSSGIHSASASPTPSERSPPPSLNSRHTRDISPPLREEEDVSDWEEGETIEDALELPRRVPFPEFGGDIVHQDNRDRDFDEVSGSEIQATDGTWEENWLFQKKKIKTIQSVPVPMLVPNSNAEYRALIGDRDADDTTDLSDNVSDQEDDEDNKFKSNIKRVLDSKHVIGGKPKLEELDFEPDSLTILDDAKEFDQFNENQQEEENLTHAINNEINDSKISEEINNLNKTNNFEDGQDSILILGIDSGPPQKAEFSIKEEIHRTILNGNSLKFDQTDSITYTDVAVDVLDGSHNVKGSTNTLSRHEREGEYEETVTIPVQRYADSLRRKHFDDDPHQIPTRDTDNDVDGLIPGSIAYRERKKWLNYVEMPNNPYSPEAIKKRLSTKSTSSLFDMITTKNNEVDDDDEVKVTSDNETGNAKTQTNVENIPERDKIDVTASHTTNSSKLEPVDGYTRMVASPTPKILKDVLAEEVPQYKRYGRDYYIKEAKRSSGARKKNGSISDISSISSLNKSSSLDNIETEFATPGFLIKQFNTIAINQHYTKFAIDQSMDSITTNSRDNNNSILIEYEDTHEDTVFSAKPAYANNDDTDEKFEEILESAYKSNLPLLNIENREVDEPEKSPTNQSIGDSYISSSSLEDSIKIYNIQTGEIMKCKPEDNVSTRYETDADTNDNIDIPDKNILGDTDDKHTLQIEVTEETVVIKERLEEDAFDQNSEIDDILSQLPKVKELAKKFVSMENLNEQTKLPQPYSWRRRKSKENILNGENEKSPNKIQYMHSLTARSISKEFREELKMSMATPLTVPGGSKEIPEGTEEVVKQTSRPGSPQPEPGTIKNKLAFFESLKSKFNNK